MHGREITEYLEDWISFSIGDMFPTWFLKTKLHVQAGLIIAPVKNAKPRGS